MNLLERLEPSSHWNSYGGMQEKSVKELWKALQAATEALPISVVKAGQLRSRFRETSCAEKTALPLPNGCFLHANVMGAGLADRRLIASQYPYADELAGGGEDFWRAVYEQSAALVDLTGPRDRMKPYYYPLEKESLSFNQMKIDCVSTTENLSIYKVTLQNQDPRHIARFHFNTWPDFGVITLQELYQLIARVEAMVPNPKDPLWIHCRAGIGRTGTLITALVIKDQITRKEMHPGNLGERLVQILLQLRSQRNAGFVQTEEQFQLLFDYAHSFFS